MKHTQKLVLVPEDLWAEIHPGTREKMRTVNPLPVSNKESAQNKKEAQNTPSPAIPTRPVMTQDSGMMNHPLMRMKKRKKQIQNNERNLFDNQQGSGISMFPVKKYLSQFKDEIERKNAFKLFKRLKKTSMHLNSNGEIFNTEAKKFIKGSNIIVLIKHVMRNNNSKPPGVKYFYKLLRHYFIPSHLVKNPRGKFLQKKRVSFRPPGILVSQKKTSSL